MSSQLESYSKEERKVNGVFYTPRFLAEYLAKKVVKYCGNKKIETVFDPACGDSILLRSLANELRNNKTKTMPRFIGADKDINAVVSSTLKFSDNLFKKIDTCFINTDSLFPFSEKKSIDGWAELRKDLKCTKGFDIALSNPPWGADLNYYDPLILNCNFNLAKGQFDIFDLFVEVILKNLSENGIYGLILPDSVFSQECKIHPKEPPIFRVN